MDPVTASTFALDLSGVDFTIVLQQLQAILPTVLPVMLMMSGFYKGLSLLKEAIR